MRFRLSEKTNLAILFIFSIWAVWPFFVSGLPNTHDGQTHVMRLASFHQALIDGQIPPRWAGNLVYGFGSPVLSFAFPLPYLLGEVFHFLGFPFVESIKAVFILGYVFSGITMFLFLLKIGKKLAAFVGTFLYLFAPYRFLDMYVRGDVGESLVFIFPPLILWLLWDQEKKDFKRIIFAAFAFGLMFLSHQIMAGVFILILFVLFFFRARLVSFILSFSLGLMLASFNLLPLIFERKLTNLDLLVATNYQKQFPTFRSLFYSRWHWGPALPNNPEISMAFQLGIAQWLAVTLLVSFLIWQRKKLKEERYRLAVIILGLLVFFLFLMTKYSEFLWQNISLLAMVLYPWRFLGAAVFLVAMLAALLVQFSPCLLRILVSAALLVLAFYGNRNHNQVVGRTVHGDSFYLSFPGTSDMWGEFLPKNLELPLKAPPEKVEVLEGRAVIKNLEIKSNEIVLNTENYEIAYLKVNNFYYPGWQVEIDGQKTKLKVSKFLEFSIPEGKHQVRVKFTETPLRHFSNVLSLLTMISLLGWTTYEFLKSR